MRTVINSLAPLCVCLTQTNRWPTTSAEFHRLNSLIRCLFIQQRRSSGMRTSSQQNTTQAKVGVNGDSSPCLRDLMYTRAFKTVSVLSLVMLTLVRNRSDCLRQSSYVCKGRPQQRSDYWQLAHHFSNSHFWRSYSANPPPQLFISPPFSLSSQAVSHWQSWTSSFWPSTITCWGTSTCSAWSPPTRSDRTSKTLCSAWNHGDIWPHTPTLNPPL